jgi:hypothetical protein
MTIKAPEASSNRHRRHPQEIRQRESSVQWDRILAVYDFHEMKGVRK